VSICRCRAVVRRCSTRLDPGGVHHPGLRADRHRAQRRVLDDYRPFQAVGELFGGDLQLLLEHASFPVTRNPTDV
jgi:hypothetical protein